MDPASAGSHFTAVLAHPFAAPRLARAGIPIASSPGMSDEKLNRKVRVWLYVIALLHLLYLGLLNRPAPPVANHTVVTHYASRLSPDASSLPRL